MINSKSTLFLVLVFSVLFAVASISGCGKSQEVQAMTDFLKQYSNMVDEFAAADEVKKAELKPKLDSFHSKWSDMEMEMDGRLTPNDLEKFDRQYKEIEKKYIALTGKS